MPVRHWAASLIGTIRPEAVSDSSSGSMTRKSSSGSRVTSVRCRIGSSIDNTLALETSRGDDSGEKLLCARLFRVREDLGGRPLLEDHAGLEEAHPVGD